MKTLYKFLIVSVVLVMTGCSDVFELDLNDDPNSPTPDQIDINFLFNNIQGEMNNFFQESYDYTASVSRQTAMIGGFFYNEANNPTDYNEMWRTVYADLLPDVQALKESANASGLTYFSATASIMEAYALVLLVDIFNDVPYSQALQGLDNISPQRDGGAEVYASAEALLTQAIADLSDPELNEIRPDIDNYYGGSEAGWISAASSILFKMYLNQRLVDGGAGAKMQALIDGGNLIADAGSDFQFQYGSTRANPDSRHPKYADWYENVDGDYMSTYMMWLINEGVDGFEDPRTKYYFYRQDGFLQDESFNVWDCVLTSTPFDNIPAGQFDHYTNVDPDLPFCIAATNGYFGRDHGNGQGIPPDGGIRTTYGLYPAGGRIDNSSFEETQESGTLGSLGEGISPLILSSYLDFMRAEAALTAGTSDDAKAMLQSAVEGSIDKVFSFSSLISTGDLKFVVATDPVTGAEITAEDAFLNDTHRDSIKANYVDAVLAAYDAAGSADEQLNVVITEFFKAAWGNGIESYNMFRRTGMPNNMPPLIDPQAAATSVYYRTALYPAEHINLNANFTDNKDAGTPVFWDNNPASLTY